MIKLKNLSFVFGLACIAVLGIIASRFIGISRATCGAVPASYFSTYTANLLQQLATPAAGPYHTCILKNVADWDGGNEIAVTRLTGVTVSEIEVRLDWKSVGQRCAIADGAVRKTFHTAAQGVEMTWDGQPVSCRNGGGLEELVVEDGVAYYVFVDNNERVSVYLH
jgi:hypothetical protein